MHLWDGIPWSSAGKRARVKPLGVTISGAISRHALSYALTKRRVAPHWAPHGAFFLKIELRSRGRFHRSLVNGGGGAGWRGVTVVETRRVKSKKKVGRRLSALKAECAIFSSILGNTYEEFNLSTFTTRLMTFFRFFFLLPGTLSDDLDRVRRKTHM